MRKIRSTKVLTLLAFCVTVNFIGAFLALTLRLPIYLDSIGTIAASCILGPSYGILTGITGNLISAMNGDIYSLFFLPVQIIIGLLSGIMYRKGYLKGKKVILGVAGFSILASIAGSFIAAMVFGGVTSSGSTYIVQVLNNLGMNEVLSVFITQGFTDYADKLVSVLLVNSAVLKVGKYLNKNIIA